MWAPIVVSLLLFSSGLGEAQGPKPRLAGEIGSGARVTLPGTRPGQVSRGVDQGAVAADMALKGMTLVFSRSEAQQADLDALMAAQQNPASPLYHQWLTPDQFAARFGVADADIAKVQSWLQAQGFSIDGVARSRDRISFDGTAGQVATAFGAELHRYAFSNQTRFAPSNDLTLPAALAPLVIDVERLSSFHPHRQTRLSPAAAHPAYTSSQTGNHFLTPLDLATMYDVSSTYQAGFNGSGQSIAIIGQSYVDTAPIYSFGIYSKAGGGALSYVLVPNSGTSGVNSQEDGDEGESQLDIEYAGGMAPGASLYLVYTGDDANAGVFDSLSYAISENIAPVISGSYGLCETEASPQDAAALNAQLQEASLQGQTVIVSAGDSGSTDCYGYSGLSTAQQTALVADYPSTAPGITSMGGTQMQTGTFSSTNTQYWQAATGSDVVSSLLSYVPESVWNEDSAMYGISAGGGGASVLFPRPSWQSGVTGIPAGTTRLVPDLALQASVDSPGYIYCTSDTSDLASEGVTASCSSGLRSPSGTFLVAGGTSFAAPVFAGLMAVLNQATNSTGQGNVNPVLYSLAASAPAAFHDITTGTNACTAGTGYCSTVGASEYAATAGYDEATGLGSIDFAKLLAAWPRASSSALTPTVTSVSLTSGTVTSGQTAQISIFPDDAPGTISGTRPTGTGTVSLDGTVLATVTFTGNTVFQNFTVPSGNGVHVITVAYQGDATHAPSIGRTTFLLGNLAPTTQTFALAAQSFSVPYNGTGSGSFVITPGTGYTGTVALSLTYSSTLTLCYEVNPNGYSSNVATPNGSPVTATLLLGEGTACGTSPTGAVVVKHGTEQAVDGDRRPVAPRRWPEGVTFAGLVGVGFLFRRGRRVRALLSVLILAGLGLGLNGCGGGSATGTTPTPPQPQTVTVTLKGVDSVNAGISASTTFTLTVQ